MTAAAQASGVLEARLNGRPAQLEQAVARELTGAGRLGVAFSGGVDSTVLLALAARALGPERVLAVVGTSASLPARELAAALRLAALIGVNVVELPTAEGDNAAYRRNGLDRCFHCKDTLFATIADELVTAHQLDTVAYGETADDLLRDDRPGSAAATQHRVLRPLASAGLGKADIRAVAAALGLPNADKPAAPCLASRIPHGSPVTADKLAAVEQAEDALHDLGFADVRVRHHGTVAGIEVPVAELDRLVASREQVVTAVRAAGFATVALDLAGLSSGNLHRLGMIGTNRTSPTVDDAR